MLDVLVDRWAARIQSFNFALPIPNFQLEDTHKLCWAALEIGKLIEREISYRANRSTPPIPLTATEFYRIPISDLSFVDDLRKRRSDAERVENHIKHNIQNTLFTMGLDKTVRITNRVKKCDSYLARIGERHQGFVRGNLAIWFYLLSYSHVVEGARNKAQEESDRTGTTSVARNDDKDEFKEFLDSLNTFREEVDKSIKNLHITGGEKENFINSIKTFVQGNCDSLIGDTRFGSPPLGDIARSIRENI